MADKIVVEIDMLNDRTGQLVLSRYGFKDLVVDSKLGRIPAMKLHPCLRLIEIFRLVFSDCCIPLQMNDFRLEMCFFKQLTPVAKIMCETQPQHSISRSRLARY